MGEPSKVCPKCGEKCTPAFKTCWKCGTPLPKLMPKGDFAETLANIQELEEAHGETEQTKNFKAMLLTQRRDNRVILGVFLLLTFPPLIHICALMRDTPFFVPCIIFTSASILVVLFMTMKHFRPCKKKSERES